jgi:hypothetical protein
MATKKKRTQDPKLAASKQKHEVATIAKRYGATQKVVRDVMKAVGRSRKAVYAELELRGYTVKPKKKK